MNKIGIRQIKCLFTAFLSVIFCISAVSAHGQNIPVTINMENVPVKRVMSEIEQQTKYLFLYTDEIDTDRLVSVNADSKPLSEVLNLVFNRTDTSFQITESNIVLSRKIDDAPKSRSVSGIVKDATGEAILGATVIIQGTTTGTTTGVDGEFSVVIPASIENPHLSINFLGYETRTIPVGSRSFFDVVMSQSTVVVDNVVITALGIKRAEKALAYNVQQVSAEAIAANKDANFINALNGKVAGVVINASSSGVGGASKVIMRGQKSIMQSSNALYVIDGVPMLKKAGAGDTQFGSTGSTDPLADINPEDIESLNVLTGAAAAALYGSDAANGAVVITTKKGQAGRLSVTVASGVEIMTPFVLPEFQNRYGTGNLNSAAGSAERSWGRKLNSANNMGYEPGKDYFQTGVVSNQNVSLSVGTDKNQTYVSAGALNSKGIIPNNKYDRYNFTFRNTTSFLNDKMTLDIGGSYILQEDRNMTNQGTYNNPIVGAYLFPRGDDWDDIKMYERYNATRKIYTQYWPAGDAGITMQNPYWVNYRNLKENSKDRYMFNAGLSYDILDWLNVSGRIRLDNTHNEHESKAYASTVKQLAGNSEYGSYGTNRSKERQIYGDALVNINKSFGDDWNLQANIGASFSDWKYRELGVSGPIGMGNKDTGLMQNLTNVFNVQNLDPNQRVPSQSGGRAQTQSVFASAEVGYKGAYYLTLTGRNDWPTALAGPRSSKSSFFYPSVGASIVFSQIFKMPENLSYMKLRASWASVGVAFDRYIANPHYAWDGSLWNSMKAYELDLNPERTQSYEIGLAMRFLKHFKFDFTFYQSNTKNQTFDPGISVGSGYSRMYIQNGNVRNRGVELSLGYENTWNKFSWSTNYTFSTNNNKIVSLAKNVTNPITGEVLDFDHLDMNGLGQAHFILKEGGSLGDMYSLMDLQRDSNGNIYVSPEGAVSSQTLSNTKDYIYLGSVLSKANMAWRNDFRVGGFNFGFMISARLGGIVFSRTQAMMDYFGVSEATAAARDRGYVEINGGDRMENVNTWYTAIAGGTAIPQYYIYSATNVRLQEASIGYTIPKKVLKDVCEISISIVGRNLWMIYNKAPFDPESMASMDNYYQGIDYFNTPSLRNVGFNLRLKF